MRSPESKAPANDPAKPEPIVDHVAFRAGHARTGDRVYGADARSDENSSNGGTK
jgi:hypothetical protein